MDQKNQRLTKHTEREAMLGLLKDRESRTPNHTNPCWVHYFWRQRIMGNDEIRRILSMGMATMSDHLRFYKDPFEPSIEEDAAASLELGSFTLLQPIIHEKKISLESETDAGMKRLSAKDEQDRQAT